MDPFLRAIILFVRGTFICCLLVVGLPVLFWWTSPSQHLPSPNRFPEVARFPSPEEAETAWSVVWRKLRRLHLVLFFSAGLPIFVALLVMWNYGWYLLERHYLGFHPHLRTAVGHIVTAASAVAVRYVIVWALERRATLLLREQLISLGLALVAQFEENPHDFWPEIGA